ncbi:unnamed protein product [Parnassius apollo]|uniref:(apollo) hypothetical protein n=1 Tax=Parnassius apollo TaxID=110799 RepID=A0A8S3XTU2_PARAO|nr:unnamed protein product [Parnassius apollo]
MMLLLLICLCLTACTASFGNNDLSAGTSDCGELGDCISENIGCNNTVGSFYNETTHDCVINIKMLLKTLTAKYDTQEKIHSEVQRVFQGVIISVILFVSCVSVCFIGVCIFCCRIHYVDNRLKKDVNALAVKLNRDCNSKRPRVKTPLNPLSESCNVVVQDAGVYVV